MTILPGVSLKVYDHPQPPARIEDVLTIEAASVEDRVQLSMVGARDRLENHLDMAEEDWASLRQAP